MMVYLKVARGPGGLGVYHAFGDPLPVQVCQGLQQELVGDEPAVQGRVRVAVLHGRAVGRGQNTDRCL